MEQNLLFAAAEKETDPMYDVSLILPDGVRNWQSPQCNFLNNSHSVTKFLIAACIGMLQDRGALSLKDPVTSFFPEAMLPPGMDEAWRGVTVEQTLQHKTGIGRIPYGIDGPDSRRLIGDDYLAHVFTLPIEHAPGSFRLYSDEAYYLLSRIIGRASGVPTAEFIREAVAEPLHWEQWALACCPKGHPLGGGGLFAKAEDIAKLGFLYANLGMYEGRRLLSEAYIRAAMEKDYACTRFRETDIFVKTGAKGQMAAFSVRRRAAAAWHGFSAQDGNRRNDRLLEAFYAYLEANYPLRGE